MAQRIEGLFTKHTVTIANGAAVSDAIRAGGGTLTAIKVPSAWTAAALTFEASFDDGTTWRPVFDDQAAEVTISSANMTTLTTGERVVVASTMLNKLAALPMFRLVSGVAGTNVNQGAARTFIVSTKA